MMQTSSKTETSLQVLGEENRASGNLELCYVLYRATTGRAAYYAVEISSAEEQDMHMLGTDSQRAQRLFEILVNETVTPCTLNEILHDMFDREEEERHLRNLYKN